MRVLFSIAPDRFDAKTQWLGWAAPNQFGDDDRQEVIERVATVAEAIEGYRGSPETSRPNTPDERFSIDEMAHQVEFLGVPCPYRNHGGARAFYVTHLNRWPGSEPDTPSIVVEV